MEKIKLPVSVVIHTKNAAATLATCLKSVSWAKEILVIDMHSTDDTVLIARKHQARVIVVNDVGFADPMRNFGISQAKQEWVLVVDADEAVSASLQNHLTKLMNDNVDVWLLPRKNIIFGKWLQFGNWWPDYQVRFFKKGMVSWSDAVHTAPHISGASKQAPAIEDYALIHHNYKTIADYVDRLNRYTGLEVKRRDTLDWQNGKIVQQAVDDFVRRFFAYGGYKDQAHGFYTSLLQGFYEFVVGLKQWEHAGFPEHAIPFPALIKYLSSSYHYWYATYRIEVSTNLFTRTYWKLKRKLRV